MMRRRPLLRAAVVGGGAYMAGKSMARRSDENAAREADQEARLSDLEQQQQQPVPQQRAPEADSSSVLDQLNELTALHERGALTDAEFAAAKAKLLNNG
jgi:hypothetical protein